MPDSFFSQNKSRKRKRSNVSSKAASSRTQPSNASSGKSKNANGASRRKKVDEELASDATGDDEFEGIDDMDLRPDSDEGPSSDEDEAETPAEKRLRLAKLYLQSVKEGLDDGGFDAAEIDKELISSRLKKDVLEHSGKIHLFIADSYDFTQPPSNTLRTRGHRFSVTSAVASESGRYLFTAGKEGSIVHWDMSSGKKLKTFYKCRLDTKLAGKGKDKAKADGSVKGHTDEVLSLALSEDEEILVSGGRDRVLTVWDVEKQEWIKGFVGPLTHKDTISALSFRKGTRQLYSASHDRTIKVYDLSTGVMGYIETLFGHQDHILALDSLRAETCLSVGGRDKTARFWKIADESQLVFRGGGRSKMREVLEGDLRGEEDADMDIDESAGQQEKTFMRKFVEGSMECIAMLDETTFVSGGDSGSICLWNTQKKKPIFTQALAHGFDDSNPEIEAVKRSPRWVTALASLPYSDLFASGSWSGEIRFWKLDKNLKSFQLVGAVTAPGVINSLQFISPVDNFLNKSSWISTGADGSATGPSKKAIIVVAGVGQEHRLGRWISVKEPGSINGSVVMAFVPRKSP